MAASEAVVRAPNSLILVGDPAGEVPESMGEALVSATSSCVAVGTLSESDGSTTIRLVDDDGVEELPPRLAFEGDLEMSNDRLTVASVLNDIYLERHVEASSVPGESG